MLCFAQPTMKVLFFLTLVTAGVEGETAKAAHGAAVVAAAIGRKAEVAAFMGGKVAMGSAGGVAHLSETVMKHVIGGLTTQGMAEGLDRPDGRIDYGKGMIALARVATHLLHCREKIKVLPDRLNVALQRIVTGYHALKIKPGNAVTNAIPLYTELKDTLKDFDAFVDEYAKSVYVGLEGEQAEVAAAEVALETEEAAKRKQARIAEFEKEKKRLKLLAHGLTLGLV